MISAGDITHANSDMCKGAFLPYTMMINNLTKTHEHNGTKQYIAGPENDKLVIMPMSQTELST